MKMVDAQQRRFTFRQALGQGGFGEVYLAEMQAPSGLTSTVAVKVLHAGLDPASQAVMRLTDEGKILSLLNHPGIVAVHDLAIIEDRVALITEFVEGADLPDCLLGPNPMPKGAIYEAFASVADALHAAHEARDPAGTALGLLHRDVKPRNIRVGKHGQVKLLDFGIATASGLAREAQTGTNALIGSFPYMAPERFKRKDEVTRSSDYYSLGCSLYELLAREKLFYQVDIAELLVPKTVPEANGDYLDERFEKVASLAPEALPLLRQMLALDPKARPSGPEIVAALEDLAADVGGTRLGRWARSRDWGSTPGEPGALTGKVIVESSPTAGSAPTTTVTWDDEPEKVGAPVTDFATTDTTTSSTIKRGLGAAALLGIGGALFLVVTTLSAGVAYYVSQGDEAPPEPTAVEPAEPLVLPEPDAPEPGEPRPVDPGPRPVQPQPPGPSPTTPITEPTDPEPSQGDAVAVVAPQAAGDAPTLDACGDLSALELASATARLTTTQRSCLARNVRSAALRQVDKRKLGRIVLADAQARCRNGDCADYEREQPWYFEEVEQSDADMMLAWASHQYKKGRNADTRRWVARALERKSQWEGRTWVDRVDELLKMDAYAAQRLWEADHKNDDLRNRAKEAAANWANHRARVKRDTSTAMALCANAAGSSEACNARVHDNAAVRTVAIGSTPAGATVRVDGEAAGTTPHRASLSFGTHTVELSLDGRTVEKRITVGTETPKSWNWKARDDVWESAY